MQRHLIKYLVPLAIGASLLALGGCASAPELRVNLDRATDFAKYRSFGFVSPLGTDRGDIQSLVSQSLIAATQRELEARGLRLDTSAPQLLINFNAAMSDKLRVASTPASTGYLGRGYYGYRSYSAWPLYADQTIVSQYTEGTLNIDVIDAARKQLVWEAVVTNSVTQRDLNDVSAALNLAVTTAFARFPIAAPGK